MSEKLPNSIIIHKPYIISCVYLLIFFVCALALFWVDILDVGVVLIVAFCFVFTIETIKKQSLHPIEFLSPLLIFIVISFITYPLKFLVYSFDPSQFFFFDVAWQSNLWQLNFNFSQDDCYLTFLIFLIGFFSFYLGYRIKTNINSRSTLDDRKIKTVIKIPSLNTLLVISILFTFIIYILQFKLGIGKLFATPIKLPFKIVGITYYIFFTSQALLLNLYFFTSIEREKKIHIFLASFMVLVVVGFSMINLSKAGLLYPILIFIVLFVLNKDKMGKYSKKLLFTAIGLILLFFALYSCLATYREITLKHGLVGGTESLKFFIPNVNVSLDGLKAIFSRLGGLDVMLPIVSYGKDNALFSGNDLLALISGADSKDYFLMYKNILGLPPERISGFEISLMGFLYMYFRIGGIIIGMFLWGKFNRFIFEIVKRIYLKSFSFGASLFVIYIQWFVYTTFGFGPNTHKMAVNIFLANVVIFLLWKTLFHINFIKKC